jgi:beta-phosphoglucomutase-like phosphatase (HAD superfamily)
MELDTLTTHWQWALDAGGRALAAASPELPNGRLDPHLRAYAHERTQTAAALGRVARVSHAHTHPWLAPAAVSPRLLALPPDTQACVFDVDGVLADSRTAHAEAWAHVLDDLLLRRAHAAGWHFVPFDPVEDYQLYIDGRPRVEGVHTFLGSRGIQVPAGEPSDPPTAETAYGIAAHKGEALEHALHARPLTALPGARAYLVAAGFAHLRRGVVSTSATTLELLELAELSSLVDARVDGTSMATRGLRPRPAPDMLRALCDDLGVAPERTVALTRSAAGLVAAGAAGLGTIAVANGAQAERLAAFGAERVVPSLSALLDPQLRAAAAA